MLAWAEVRPKTAVSATKLKDLKSVFIVVL